MLITLVCNIEINTINTIWHPHTFLVNDKKDKKDYFLEIRTDNDTNWHPHSYNPR